MLLDIVVIKKFHIISTRHSLIIIKRKMLLTNCDADGNGHPDFPFSDGDTITIGETQRQTIP